MRRLNAGNLGPHLDAVRRSFERSREGIQAGDPARVARALNRALEHLDAADRLRAAEARLAQRLRTA